MARPLGFFWPGVWYQYPAECRAPGWFPLTHATWAPLWTLRKGIQGQRNFIFVPDCSKGQKIQSILLK